MSGGCSKEPSVGVWGGALERSNAREVSRGVEARCRQVGQRAADPLPQSASHCLLLSHATAQGESNKGKWGVAGGGWAGVIFYPEGSDLRGEVRGWMYRLALGLGTGRLRDACQKQADEKDP